MKWVQFKQADSEDEATFVSQRQCKRSETFIDQLLAYHIHSFCSLSFTSYYVYIFIHCKTVARNKKKKQANYDLN